MSELVTLHYKGHPYYARDVRYWLRAVSDGFVYESSDDPISLLEQANGVVEVWDREAAAWVAVPKEAEK